MKAARVLGALAFKAAQSSHSTTILKLRVRTSGIIALEDFSCIDIMLPETNATMSQLAKIRVDGRGVKRSTAYWAELNLNRQTLFGTHMLEMDVQHPKSTDYMRPTWECGPDNFHPE